MITKCKERIFRRNPDYTSRIAPCNYNEFILYISDFIDNLNYGNKELLDKLYIQYLNLYDSYYKKIINFKAITAAAFGVYSKTRYNINYYLARGWSSDIAIQRIKFEQDKRSFKKLSITTDMTDTEIQLRNDKISEKIRSTFRAHPNYKEMCKHKGRSMQYDFYLTKINPKTGNTYTEIEAKQFISARATAQVNKYHDDVRSGKRNAPINTTQLQYYINKGMTIEDGVSALKKRQNTYGLNLLIEKYGYDIGFKMWKKRQCKWQDKLNNKSDAEKKELLIKKTKHSKRYSKESSIFINLFLQILHDEFKIDLFDSIIQYGESELFIYDTENKRIFFYDLYIDKYKLIIEYNGSKFHPSPLLTDIERENWKQLCTYKSAYTVDENDLKKKNLAIAKGYKIISVWDYQVNSYIKIKNIIRDELISTGFIE